MFARIHAGYRQGVAHHVYGGPPMYGQLVSDDAKGVEVVRLWPYDFPLSARHNGADVKPLASLWRPELSGFIDGQFALRGLEPIRSSHGTRWVLQRWLCQPMTYQQILDQLKADQARKSGVVSSQMPPSPPPPDPMNPFAT